MLFPLSGSVGDVRPRGGGREKGENGTFALNTLLKMSATNELYLTKLRKTK